MHDHNCVVSGHGRCAGWRAWSCSRRAGIDDSATKRRLTSGDTRPSGLTSSRWLPVPGPGTAAAQFVHRPSCLARVAKALSDTSASSTARRSAGCRGLVLASRAVRLWKYEAVPVGAGMKSPGVDQTMFWTFGFRSRAHAAVGPGGTRRPNLRSPHAHGSRPPGPSRRPAAALVAPGPPGTTHSARPKNS